MKLSKRDKGLLLIVAALLIFFIVYKSVYQNNLTKIDQENTKLSALKTEESELVELETNKEFYESEIERMEKENDEIIAQYPANILPENQIMYIVELTEQTGATFSSMSYGSAVDVITGYEDETNVRAYNVTMGLSYQTTYQGLKDLIKYNNGKTERMVFNTITCAYDSTTGNLSGSLTLDQYYMTGTDVVYKAPYVSAINIGRDNIFGTMEED